MDPRGSNHAGEGAELSLIPVKVARAPRGTRTVLESGPILRGQIDQERAAPGAPENHQNASARVATPAGQP